ncbi:MAG: S8 family serine peptidase [Lyngbya sp.]|nr:S8 family serine peptidase [Lyngbya sp.]
MFTHEPITRLNSVISQGDVALNTDEIRNTLNLDGSGIKIGIISDSFNLVQEGVTAADDIRSGDLPGVGNPDGYTTPVQVLNEGSRGKDEGRAMLQIVHDIAPGSELMFYGVSNEVEMAQAIDALAAAGADIIVDDMGFTNQPFFQDGIAAQAVNRVVDQGVVYFSAAGNDGQRSYESEFSNSANTFTVNGITYEAHDFDAGAGVDLFNQFSLDAGEKLGPLTLQWDEPFASVGGSGATSDLDIFIVKKDALNLSADDIVASSTDNNVGADPLETLSFTNNTDSRQFYVLIGKRVDSTEPNQIKYINFSNGADNFEYGHNSSTVFGHPNAEGAITIGATSYNNTPEFGTGVPKAKSTSSVGGTPILMAEDGKRLDSPLVRQKPNLLATDGVNTTFFGSDSSSDSDAFPNFSGTSAAAPHAAGVAALMLQAGGGADSLTPAEVRSILEETALDADFAGLDFKSGSGLIQASKAVELITPQSAVVAENDTAITRVSRDGNENSVVGTLENDILTGSSTNDVLLGYEGDDQLLGEAGNDVLYGGQGNDILLGRQGNDLLSGNLGDDVLIGGEGNDRFDLGLQAGVDVIKDFTPGEDIIGLSDGLTYADLTISFQNGSTIIAAENQTLAKLDGLHSLSEQNFISI